MSKFWRIPKVLKPRPHAQLNGTAPDSRSAAPSPQHVPQVLRKQVDIPLEAARTSYGETLKEQAWNAHISDGLLRSGYHAERAGAVLNRVTDAARYSDLSARLAAYEAELEAAIYQAPAEPGPPAPLPTPKVLHPVSHILPFKNGVSS